MRNPQHKASTLLTITSDDLATVVVRRVIFHDIPKGTKAGSPDAGPTLSTVETEVDAPRKALLKTKLTKVVASKSSYPVSFRADTKSPVPKVVRYLTEKHRSSKEFVEATQELAKYLFEQHIGSVSPGLLCVIEVTADGKPAVILMKLERENGAQLELKDEKGVKTYLMSVWDNLVLTDGTRLFKTAMFLRKDKGDDDFGTAVCEGQTQVISSDDFAKYWMRFLGCNFLQEPRITTHHFFQGVVDFINTAVTDSVDKATIYDSLQSEMTSNKATFHPKKFIEEYIPDTYQSELSSHLKDNKIPLTVFQKDTSDIATKLRRRAYQTTKGAMISTPEDQPDLVTVTEDKVIVNDTLAKVK
jgi:hypothetical protein